MLIKDIFRKKINREIQGVIIVGQGEDTNVSQELEEYVVTRELQKHFADFFSAYKKCFLSKKTASIKTCDFFASLENFAYLCNAFKK